MINEIHPDIVHFSGHGQTGALLVHDSQHGGRPLLDERLVALFSTLTNSSVRLVILTACCSLSMAEKLVGYVDYSIGMKFSITDSSATIFSKYFYSALGYNLSLDMAFKQALAAIKMEGTVRGLHLSEVDNNTEQPFTEEYIQAYPEQFKLLEEEEILVYDESFTP